MTWLRVRFAYLLFVCLLPTVVYAQVVVVPGAGAEPLVRIIRADGTNSSFFAYDPSFTGGVRVALGDVDGDGILDIITGAGPGGGPHVRVFSGKDFSEIWSFFAYDPSFTGGVSVAAGDVDGDGRADIITGAGPGGGPHVRVFSGANLSEIWSFFAYTPGFTGGVSVAAGDVDGDGRADIITGAGPGGGPHVRVFSGASLLEIWSFYAYSPFFTGGVSVAAGDVNGDGRDDIITGAGPGGGPHVRVFSGINLSEIWSFYAYTPGFTGGVRVAAIDFDGDGVPEIVTGAGPGGGPHVRVLRASDLAELGGLFAFDPSFTGGVFVGSFGGGVPLRFTSANTASFTTGTVGSFPVTTSGGAGSRSLTISGTLPAGVTFTGGGGGNGTLSGPPGPGTAGTYPLTFTVTDARGVSAPQAFTLLVQPGSEPPAITSGNVVTFNVGAASSFTVTTTGFPAPALTATGIRPQGVTFTDNGNGTATLSGTPDAGTNGIYPLTLTASSSAGTATQNLTLTVGAVTGGAPTITSANATTFIVGTAGTFTITTTGTPTPAITRTGTLPAGVAFTDNGDGTATLAGTPAAGSAGPYPVTFTAANGVGIPATQSFTLTVGTSSATPIFTSAQSAAFTVGGAGTFTITTSATPAVTAITRTGTLPTGVTFTDNGNGTATLTGTPAAGTSGAYALTFTATNGTPATQNFVLIVQQSASITSAPAATFSVGVFSTFTVTTAGLPAPALLAAGALPGGVSFVDNGNGTATLSGIPGGGSGGMYPLTITAVNGVGAPGTQSFTLTVSQAPGFTSPAAATFVIGTPNTFIVTTNGVPSATFVASGSLPASVLFTDNGNGTATLAGMPQPGTDGTYPLTITATNVAGAAPQSFVLTVTNPSTPIITSATSTIFNVGALGSFTVTTAAFPVATAITELGGLPASVTFVTNGDGTATLSGRPNPGTAGIYPLVIQASNGGPSTNQTFTLVVGAVAGGKPVITSANTTILVIGTPAAFTITTTGTPTAAISEVGPLPLGVTFTDNFDGTATIAGPAQAGTAGVYPVTITASNTAGAAIQNFTLVIKNVTATPIFTSAPSTTFTIGAAGTFSITTAATPAVTSITRVGVLPANVSFVDNGNGTATLSGTPQALTADEYPITFTATGPGGTTTQSFTLKVQQVASITSAASTTFTTGSAGTFTVTGAGVPTPALTMTGTPVAGVTFVDNGNGTGTLSGTPAAGTGGTHPFTVTAINGVGATATQSFTLTVNDAGSFTSANNAAFTVGVAGTFSITTSSFPVATTITRTGALPTGVTFTSNGDGTATLGGMPAAGQGGTYPLTFTFDNGVAGPVTQNFTLTVQGPPQITSATSTTFTVGTAATFTVTATGVPAPTITQTGGTLPTGVTFTSATGVLAGPATQTGPFPLQFTAANGVVPDAVQAFTLTVVCPAITVNPSTLPDGLFQTAYGPVTFTQTGSTGSSFTWSATGLPTGIAIAPTTGIVSGTPTNTVLNAAVAITVTDNFGCTGVRNTTINIRPVAGGDTFGNAVGNTQLAVGAVGALPATPTAVLSGNVKTNDNGPGALLVAFPATSTNAGVIVEGAADGSFIYTPAANFAGASDTFTYTLTDGNGITNTATVTITFLNRVWYVNSAGGNGDGRSHNPFNSLANAAAPSQSGDIIYVHTGGATTPGNLAMDASSTLQGAGGTLSLNAGALVIPATAAPTLPGTVTLADNTAIRNVNFSGAAPAMTASNLATTQAIVIDGVSVTSGTSALSLTNVTGANTLTVSNSSFTNTTGVEVLVNGGNMPLAIGATISSNAGRAIDIQNRTSGAVTFSGSVTDSGGTGVILNSNGTSTFSFSGGVTLNGASSTFTATSSGTLNITGTNTIGATTAPTGPALNVTSTTIGASGLTFQRISATGGVNGIVLNNTGSTAGLTVTGSGTANSGGTIQNSTAAGISLTSTRSPSFDRMQMSGTGDSGVNGTQVTNFSFTNGSITNAGNANFESAIGFNGVTTGLGNNISGTVVVTGNTFTNPFYSGLDVQSDNGTITNATVSNNAIGNPGFSGVNFVGTNNTTTVFNLTKATISGNTVTSTGGAGIQVSISASNATGPGAVAGTVSIVNGIPVGDVTNVIAITGNSISVDAGGTQAITVANSGGNPGSRTQTNFIIQGNGTGGSPLVGSSIGTTILVGNNGFADMAGVVDNNVINANHTANGGGGNGIAGGNGVAGAGNAWTPRLNLTVTANTITNTDGNGILLVGRSTSGQAYLKIQNNNVAAPINAGGTGRPGIRVDAGNAASADDSVFVNISGNTTAGSNGAPGIGIRKQGTVATTNDFGIQGLSPSPATAAQAEDFVATQNPGSALGDGAAGFPVKRAFVINGDNFVTTILVP